MNEKAISRFWSWVDTDGNCWVWTGARRKAGGYGVFSLGRGVNLAAHRVAYELANGPIPDGMFVCHTCDNKQCVRPDHLFLGTHQQNMDDAKAKGLFPKGDNNPARLYPELKPRGDDHWTHQQPERLVRGDAHWRRQHPERNPRGEQHPMVKLSEGDVRAIRQLASEGLDNRVLADRYQVHITTVRRIVNRTNWTHI